MTKPDLGTFGVFGHYAQFRTLTPQHLRDIEALGYGAIWAGGSPPAELDWIEPLLEPTTTLQIATGIVNIWTAAAGPVAESFHRIDKAYPTGSSSASALATPKRTPSTRSPMTRSSNTSTSWTNTAYRRIAGWSRPSVRRS